jgi:hypothetical protein
VKWWPGMTRGGRTFAACSPVGETSITRWSTCSGSTGRTCAGATGAPETGPRAPHPGHQHRALALVRGGGRGRDLSGAAERLDLEGIVAKRKADAYVPTTIWYKVKNRAYTQLEGRGELFHPKPR